MQMMITSREYSMVTICVYYSQDDLSETIKLVFKATWFLRHNFFRSPCFNKFCHISFPGWTTLRTFESCSSLWIVSSSNTAVSFRGIPSVASTSCFRKLQYHEYFMTLNFSCSYFQKFLWHEFLRSADFRAYLGNDDRTLSALLSKK